MRTLVARPTDTEADTIAEVLRRLRPTGLAADILRVDNASRENIPPSPHPDVRRAPDRHLTVVRAWSSLSRGAPGR